MLMQAQPALCLRATNPNCEAMVKVAMFVSVMSLVAASLESPVSGIETTRDPVFLQSAGQANSEADLQLWRDEQVRRVRASVPSGHQQFALDSIEQEYMQRLSQIAGSSSISSTQSFPAFLFLTSAKRCQTVEELQSWHATQLDQIKQLVPAEYQQVGLDSIEGEYQKHAARLSQLPEVDASEATALANLPVLQINAEEYRTQRELEEWRAKQAAQIERFVPTGYQQIALNSVDKEFEMRVADLDTSAPEGQVNLSSDVPISNGITRAGKAVRLGAIVGLAAVVGVAARAWKGKQSGDGNVYLLADEKVTA
jgi:hypothetical protein